MNNLGTIIIKPIITEKSMQEAKNGKYTFLVATGATKPVIRKEITDLFGVKVEKVYTSVIKTTTSRQTRFGRKNKELSYKKARVKLVKGAKIDLFDEVVEDKK